MRWVEPCLLINLHVATIRQGLHNIARRAGLLRAPPSPGAHAQTGLTCSKALGTRQAQDFAAWALALAAGQQLPVELDNYLRTIVDINSQ